MTLTSKQNGRKEGKGGGRGQTDHLDASGGGRALPGGYILTPTHPLFPLPPLSYDPALIELYWSSRPYAIVSRCVQLMSIGGTFFTGLLFDLVMVTEGGRLRKGGLAFIR